ncbi:MAG: hypothetical protein K2Y21_00515 [Phycisphaerales bacterium]|nr:hypothetical protein [Phycisphaerales bacterium]
MSRARRVWIAAAWMAGWVLLAPGVSAQTCGRWLFGPGQERGDLNGPIVAMAKWDPDGPGPQGEWLVIGGSFTSYGGNASTVPPCGPVVAWDGGMYRTFGSPAVLTSGSVSAIGTFQGGLYIAARNAGGVLRWNGTTWTVVGNLQGTVTRLLEYRGELVAVGTLALLDGTGSAAARFRNGAWELLGSSSKDARGLGACVFRDELIVAGFFTSIGGVSALNIARWDGAAWSALGDGLTAQNVWDVIEYDGRLVAVGQITASGAKPLANTAAWDGVSWSPLGQLPNNAPGRALVFEGRLHAIDLGGRPFRWDGLQWLTLLPAGAGVGSGRSGLAIEYGGDLIVGGQFTISSTDGTYGATATLITNLARYVHGGVQGLGLGAVGPSSSLTNAVEFNGSLVLSGGVETASGKSSYGAARWNGVDMEGMGPMRPLGTVDWLVRWQNRLIGAGSFNTLLPLAGGTGVLVQVMIQWDGTAWVPFGVGNRYPTALTDCGGVLTTASASTSGGVTTGQVRRWNGSAWVQVGGTADGTVDAVAQFGTDLIAAGQFQNFEGRPALRVARWNGTTWDAMGEGLNGRVWALHVHNGELYAAGAFTASGATPVSRIAKWDGAAWVAVGDGFNDEVFKMHTHKGELIAGGKFTASGATGVSRIARLRGGVWTPLAGGLASTGGEVYGLATYRDELIAVGSFARAEGLRSVCWARWTDDGVGDITDQPVGGTFLCGERVVLSARQVNGYTPMRAQWFRDGLPFDPSGMADVRQIDSGGRSLLIFDRIDARRAGVYSCRMITDCGSVDSESTVVGVVGACCPGDVNGDGLVDDIDFQLFVQQYAIMDCFDPDMPPLCLADLNLDSFVTDEDFMLFLVGYDALLCAGS